LPASSSLLNLLWQDEQRCHGAEVIWHHSEETEQTTTDKAVTHQHITMPPADYKPEPSIPASAQIMAQQSPQRPEFSWAGTSARAVGVALHAALQHIAETGIEHWQKKNLPTLLQMMTTVLHHEGISQEHLPRAIKRCEQGLNNIFTSSRAAWILSGQHQDAHQEWAITHVEADICKHLVLDRSFIDKHGIRWVIDYKTGWHQDDDLDVWLDQELYRYTEETPQLPGYVKALQALEPERQIKAALYFPMVDGWRVWPAAANATPGKSIKGDTP